METNNGEGQNNPNPQPKPAGTGGANGNGGEGGGDNEFTSLEEANKVIKALRKENASRRTAGKSQEDQLAALTEKLNKITGHLGLDSDEADPEEVIKGLTSTNSQLEMDLAIVQMARVNNISPEHDDYFRFLVQKRIQEFEASAKDGDELPEDFFENVAKEVSQYSGQGGGQQRQSLGANNGGKKPVPPNGGSLSVEQFANLSFAEKASMKQQNPQEYAKLWHEALAKKLI